MKKITSSFILMILFLVSCTSTPPQTPTTTPVLLGTYTPTLAPTATPTNTLQPTATACVTEPNSVSTLNSVQDKTSALIPNATAIWYEDFHCNEISSGWGVAHAGPTTNISVANGVITISVQKVEGKWEGISPGSNSLEDNKGMLVLFKYTADTLANLFISTGEWQTPNYRRWGLTTDNSSRMWVGWEGSHWLSSYFPPEVLRPETWFYLTISLGDDGQVTMKIWEKDDPNNHTDFQKRMPDSWKGRNWLSLFQLYEGTLEIDEYLEFSFEKP
ncbi:MAG TPA: hypothetical protein PKL78_04130 [Anaerolineales bacterium]|nr:hypothetical protein [Anaerolineales bacterium]